MTRSFPNLGFDPAPGDVEETRALARTLGNLAGELDRTVGELSRIDVTDWKGKAARSFSDHVEEDVQPLISKAQQSFDGAASAMNRWVTQLAGFQSEADRLEREAAGLQASLDAAVKAADAPAPDSAGSSGSSHGAHDHSDSDKKRAVSRADSALNDCVGRAHELHDRYSRAASAIGRSLVRAGDVAPDKPGFFASLAQDVEDAWDATTDWVKDHADLIKFVSDILGDISGVLGILAIITAPFEPLGAIFAGASLATGALALVGDLVAKAAGADVSWTTIGLGVLGVVPGLGVLGKGMKVADAATATAKAAELGEGFRGVSQIGRNIVGVGDRVAGAVSFTVKGKTIGLFGMKWAPMVKATGTMNRLRLLSENSYRGGQLIGVKGYNAITKIPIRGLPKVALDPMSRLGRGLDAGIKAGTKALGIPGQIDDGRAATAH
jgi:hypothetical protein